MNNLNEIGKLDSMFRDAAIDYELPFNEDGWDLMKHKLNNTESKKKRGIFWWLPLAVLAVGSGIFTFNLKNNSQKNFELAHQTKAISTNENVDNNKIEPKKQEPIIPNTTTKNNSINEKEFVVNKQNTIAEKNDVKEKIKTNSSNLATNVINNGLLNQQKNSGNINIDNLDKKNASNSTSNIIPIIATNQNNATQLENSNLKKEYISSLENYTTVKSGNRYYTATNLLLHNRYIVNFKKLEKENVSIVAAREIEAKKQAEKAKYPNIIPFINRNEASSNWYVQASLANNIGYVSKPQLNQSSLQYAIGLGYNFNKNVSLQTGIFFGTRNFGMRRDQFSYKGDPSLGKYIKGAEADISLIDIPITVRYQYSNIENTGWFSTIGISTLFLKKENYILTVDNGSSPIWYLNQNFSNTNSRLSMLNLSLGYQYPINKLFTLTIEPYIQLPFKAIGEGGMKLSSTGLQVSGKYSFFKNKK